MCRFLVYKGSEIIMADLLTRSEHSLIMQSYKAEERKEPLNGDGFGVGWYDYEVDNIPCVFTSVYPAWNNRNLRRLADKIRSTCLFAHVRAASVDSPVTDLNCHPFQYEQFLWMHNGQLPDFKEIKRQLRESLRDEVYDFIQGNTDSEHAFALFLNILWPHMDDYSVLTLKNAMISMIEQLNKWYDEAGISETSHYNFAVTDGQSLVVTRYAFGSNEKPQSLYYLLGKKFESHEGEYRMVPADRHPQAVIVASEPLTRLREQWTSVPENHLIMVTPELHVKVAPIRQ